MKKHSILAALVMFMTTAALAAAVEKPKEKEKDLNHGQPGQGSVGTAKLMNPILPSPRSGGEVRDRAETAHCSAAFLFSSHDFFLSLLETQEKID